MLRTMSASIIIKIGTGVLTQDDGTLDGGSLVKLVTAVAGLQKSGYSCIMVSSGAVGAGVSALGLEAYPKDTDTKQAAAAVGQARLMQTYETLFQNFDLHVAQLLLTGSDLQDNQKRVLATLNRLLEEKTIIPIINENDSVAVEELKVGDNDMLSARVAELVGASQLILLTGVDGLMPPEGNDIIEEVSDVNDVLDFARDDSGKFSVGGMASKLKAVSYATGNGTSVIIANGRDPEQLGDLVSGKGKGTRFIVK